MDAAKGFNDLSIISELLGTGIPFIIIIAIFFLGFYTQKNKKMPLLTYAKYWIPAFLIVSILLLLHAFIPQSTYPEYSFLLKSAVILTLIVSVFWKKKK